MDHNSDQRLIKQNYLNIQGQISAIADAVGRDPDAIRLVVVTKGHPVGSVQQVVDAGAELLGENYVEEAIEKMDAIVSSKRIEWHMIGHIQSRKARLVSEHFDTIHSLDSLKLARRLDHFARQQNRIIPVLLECNVSGETSKYGWPAWIDGQFDEFVPVVDELIRFPNLEIHGLMTMPPFSDHPETSRPYFQRLCSLQQYLKEKFTGVSWDDLSMGMSQDYLVAIEEGATILRIGTAIMGPRPA